MESQETNSNYIASANRTEFAEASTEDETSHIESSNDNNQAAQQDIPGTSDQQSVAPSTPGSSARQCWVCFGTDSDEDLWRSNNRWLCPCKCRGSMKWVHEECLQRWIDEKQRLSLMRVFHCSQCQTPYVIMFPPSNRLVKMLERYEVFLSNSSIFMAVVGVFGCIYWCCISYGTLCICQIMGEEEGQRVIEEIDPALLMIGLPCIPIMLVLARLIKWEDLILKCWRSRSPKIPPVLSYVLGEPPANPRGVSDEILFEPSYSEPIGGARMICGALMLPTMASLMGSLLFQRVTSSTLQRSLLGGLTFLLLKGALKIYLRKSQYVRFSQRIIMDYNKRDEDQSGPSTGSGELANHSGRESANQSDHRRDHQGHNSYSQELSTFVETPSSSTSSLVEDLSEQEDMLNGGRTLFRMYFRIRSRSRG